MMRKNKEFISENKCKSLQMSLPLVQMSGFNISKGASTNLPSH